MQLLRIEIVIFFFSRCDDLNQNFENERNPPKNSLQVIESGLLPGSSKLKEFVLTLDGRMKFHTPVGV